MNYRNTIVLSGKANDMKNGIIQYLKNNERTPDIILINITRTKQAYLSYAGIEQIKDMFFYCGKYEGGMVCDTSPHVICFSNDEPDYDRVSIDRWKIQDVRGGPLCTYAQIIIRRKINKAILALKIQ